MIKRAFAFSRLNYPKHIIKQQRSQLSGHQRFCFGSELPKQSRFSQFMGLTKDLQQIRYKQVKREQSQTRVASFFVVIAIIVIGSTVGLLVYDEKSNFIVKISFARLTMNFSKAMASRKRTLKETLALIDSHNQKYPYEYVQTLYMLLTLTKQAKQIKGQTFLLQLGQIYSFILRRNFRAGQNKLFIQGVSQLMEACIADKIQINQKLIDIVLLNGSIKEVFLAVRYSLTVAKRIQAVRNNKMLLECLAQNIKKKIRESNEYYESISLERLKEDYPQIQFKRQLESQWTRFIQQQLRISFKQQP